MRFSTIFTRSPALNDCPVTVTALPRFAFAGLTRARALTTAAGLATTLTFALTVLFDSAPVRVTVCVPTLIDAAVFQE